MSNRDWGYIGALVYASLYWSAIIAMALAWHLPVVALIAVLGVGAAFVQNVCTSMRLPILEGFFWLTSNSLAVGAVVALLIQTL